MNFIFITYVLQIFQKELARAKWAALSAPNLSPTCIIFILLFFFQIPLYTTLMTVLLVEHPGADVAVAVRVCVLAVVGVFRCRDLNFFLLILTSAPTCHTAKRKKNTYHVNIFFFVSNNFFEGFLLPKKQATRFKSLTAGPMPR